MAGNKISEYDVITTLASGDKIDISKDAGASVYLTRAITYANFLAEIQADITITYLKITPMTSAQFATIISDETGTGVLVFSNTPTLVTPNIGVATATSINGNAFNGAVGSTWNLANGKTFSSLKSITLDSLGDGITATFQATSGTVAYLTDISNVATDNMTIDDNARYIRLKAGYTTTQYFQIQNTGGENFIKWLGDGTVQARGQYFFNAATNGGQELYVIRAKSFGGFEKFRVQAEDNQGIVDIWGNQAYQLISLNSTSTSYFYNTLSIGSDTANASAILDITSTTKGFGLPSMTSAQRSAIASPKEGLLVYQNDGTENVYAYVNSAWTTLGSAGAVMNIGTGTYTPNTAIVGVTRTTVTVTVTGALTTDKVVANMNDAMRADFVTAVSYFLDMQAYVSAADTVTITYSVSTYTTFGASSSINVMVQR
jgi:hypothetical protein